MTMIDLARKLDEEGADSGTEGLLCWGPDVAELEAERDRLAEENEQLRVQLAGCSVAACGGTSEAVLAREGDYGWSVAYQETLELARERDRLREAIQQALRASADEGRPNVPLWHEVLRSALTEEEPTA
ncbi:MAG: hypothetical protein AAGH64_08540 [Planctomycetota bacterium]